MENLKPNIPTPGGSEEDFQPARFFFRYLCSSVAEPGRTKFLNELMREATKNPCTAVSAELQSMADAGLVLKSVHDDFQNDSTPSFLLMTANKSRKTLDEAISTKEQALHQFQGNFQEGFARRNAMTSLLQTLVVLAEQEKFEYWDFYSTDRRTLSVVDQKLESVGMTIDRLKQLAEYLQVVAGLEDTVPSKHESLQAAVFTELLKMVGGGTMRINVPTVFFEMGSIDAQAVYLGHVVAGLAASVARAKLTMADFAKLDAKGKDAAKKIVEVYLKELKLANEPSFEMEDYESKDGGTSEVDKLLDSLDAAFGHLRERVSQLKAAAAEAEEEAAAKEKADAAAAKEKADANRAMNFALL